jgi:hypothetical protein
VVIELRGDDVVLATVRPKAATAALVGDEAPAAIGGQQGVDEHE